MCKKRTLLWLWVALLLWPPAGGAQSATYLALLREGTASVIRAPDTLTAFVTDGGQKGSLLDRPILGGQPLLRSLFDDGYRNLVITCSHPHADHMAGLLELVRHRATTPDDVDLTFFERVVFVDSGYPVEASLFREFELTHGRRGGVGHVTALNRNAFGSEDLAGLVPTDSSVRVSNFEYEPVGASGEHGHAMITHYLLATEDAGESSVVVDFDDAASEVIKGWAEGAPAALPETLGRSLSAAGFRVYVAPHHSSDLTDIDPLLGAGLRPDAVVITVNPANRFGHPGPTNWLRWIDELGVENVHLTGAGQAVEITAAGVPPVAAETQARIRERVLGPMVRRVERDLAELAEVAAEAPDVNLGELRRERRRAKITQVQLAAAVGVTGAEVRAWENGTEPVREEMVPLVGQALHESRVRWKLGRLESTRAILDSIDRAYGAGEGSGNQKRLTAWSRDLNSAFPGGPASGGGDPPPGPKPPPGGLSGPRPAPSGPQGGVGGYKDLNDRFGQGYRGGDVPGPGGGGRGPARVRRFRSSASGPPIFGGVIIGNSVGSKGDLTAATIQVREGIEDGESVAVPEIWVSVSASAENEWYVYDDLTFTELWAAYHYVKPPSNWKEQFGVSDGECNLIGVNGKTKDEDGEETGWRFGIHPAIANTVLSRDGMRLDMMLSVLNSSFGVPPSIETSLAELPSWSTYQWYDAPSEVVLHSGRLDVKPAEGPPDSLLRVRFWRYGSADADEGSALEVPTEELARLLHLEYSAVQRIDRFARTVAVLNWIADQELVEFPALPSEVQPARMAATAELRYEDALPYFRVGELQWEDIRTCLIVLLVTAVLMAVGVTALGLWFYRRRRRRREANATMSK